MAMADESRDYLIVTWKANCVYLVLGSLLCMALSGEGLVFLLLILAGGLAMNHHCAQVLNVHPASHRHKLTWQFAMFQLPVHAMVTVPCVFIAFASSFMTGKTPASVSAILLMCLGNIGYCITIFFCCCYCHYSGKHLAVAGVLEFLLAAPWLLWLLMTALI